MPRTLSSLSALLLAGITSLAAQTPAMNFFITSRGSGNGAALGGLEGADAHCSELARAAGSSGLVWHAYLSAKAAMGKPAVDARDRIGKGPWFNHAGVQIARDVGQLHSDSNNLNKRTGLTEKGDTVNGRGDTPNMHDILTGSAPNGTLMPGDGDTTCGNWTSSAAEGSAQVGHFDRVGGGANPTSWNSAHPSRGCGQQNLQATGGNGLFYCFGSP
ncbi:MAG TPA: hypothetical protein VGQ69_07160 [Gemmatimonadales bacterium]|jgi:hypothetical protein|nr:hypothetical protein [Gemmatimonadales bacterium]